MTANKRKFELWTVVSIVLLTVFLVFLVYPLFGLLKQSIYNQDGQLSAENFYRFFTYSDMHRFFARYREIMTQNGPLGGFVRSVANGDATAAVEAICRRFNEGEPCGVVPKDPHSACKRVCMFLRWMVRTDSPVDLGLWTDFIDRRTLVIPLDTHVVQEARRLGLLTSACTSMSVARRLTAKLAEVFPDDPCRGDFALFGYGVDESSAAKKGDSE